MFATKQVIRGFVEVERMTRYEYTEDTHGSLTTLVVVI